MLDQTTKRKIDSARNILVGKVPDPKAQVEQITTALVYKFMDDMDKESEELGGKTRFFTNSFSQYSWTKLLDKKLSGEERLDLYVQAITNMSKNPHIPPLFRDIFKGAFLPFRDPRTLTLFIKEINEFTYEHSENLGNAFEYLLSILGSQGDAGQFRTPRHIIDFITDVVNPKKNEIILDPACGTAGFLISAYKRILKNHDGLDNKTGKPTNKEKNLTPGEKTKLMNNILGYDISPDMVKLSLVNMYLHGFQNPQIHEYDSLTSEKRWDEMFDVIMANPPFMTPKGGIKPHKKFSIQANRSEVLFVDYIMEHLRIDGRAGIIVPEGIIFKSENAYKQLRKTLIENGLFAVISLPSGVFQPYSGVKTSILILDKKGSKQTDEILFLKIENDGYGLGAQRRPIEKNDLPEALEILEKWKTGKKKKSDIVLWVGKDKLAKDGDYNLTGERYREVDIPKHKKWSMVRLGEVLTYEQPTKYIVKSTNYKDEHSTPVLTAGKSFVLGFTDEKDGIFAQNSLPVIIFDDFTTANKFVDFPFKVKSSAMKILKVNDKSEADIKFIFCVMKNIKFDASRHKRYWIAEYSKLKIPLPPLKVQKEIVEQIEVKQNAINHAKGIIKNLERERRYFGQEVKKLENVEWVKLGEICERILSGGTPSTKEPDYWQGDIPWVTSADIVSDTEISVRKHIAQKAVEESTTNLIKKGNIIVATRVGLGKLAVNDLDICINQDLQGLILKPSINAHYLALILQQEVKKFQDISQGSTIQGVTKDRLSKIKIPLPSLKIQKQLVEEAEREEEIIKANKKLIELMEKKISDVLSEI